MVSLLVLTIPKFRIDWTVLPFQIQDCDVVAYGNDDSVMAQIGYGNTPAFSL